MSVAAVHPAAIVETRAVPAGTAVGAFSRVGSEVEIAAPCSIGEHAFLDGPIRIEGGVRIGPRCCIQAEPGAPVTVCEEAFLGANATIWPGVSVGRRARVEPGSVVTKNVPAMAVVAGNPAQIVRYCGAPATPPEARTAALADITETPIRGVTLRRLPLHEDLRGNLTFGEAQRHVPFAIRRYFLTFDVSTEQARGEHAHRTLHQFLICVHGRVHIAADDGSHQADFLLDRPDAGLHIPPMTWSVQYRFSSDAVLLVLCSDVYDPADYIRDYAEFLALARR